jgi:hypothetical protein
MRSRDRLLVSAGWLIAILVSATAIVTASCGGPAGTPSPSEQAATAIAEAEKALSQAELWDSRTGNAVARAVKRETLGADAFNAFATARPCALIATMAAEKMRLLLDWQRPPGSDRCWEIRAFNATGESAPVWYCLPD